MERTVVVTGVSTGIGWGITKVLTENGFHVFGSVRKKADAERLSKEFGEAYTPLIFDVTDAAAVGKAAKLVADKLDGRTLTGLVNNAGVSFNGPLQHMPVENFRKQLEVNLTGVLISTQAFAPLLGTDLKRKGEPGRLFNIGSIGGRNAFPFTGPYHTTKFGLEGFTESLRRELMLYRIEVVLIAPGSIATPIWDKAEQQDTSEYKKTGYADAIESVFAARAKLADNGLPPERVGEVILKAMNARKPKVRYVVARNPFEIFLGERLPRRWVDAIIAKRLDMKPLR